MMRTKLTASFMTRLDSSLFSLLFFCMRFSLWVVAGIMTAPGSSFADKDFSCSPKPPYEAPKFIEPQRKPEISKLHLVDNKDGTNTDADSGLLWTKKRQLRRSGKMPNMRGVDRLSGED